jgi:perosamine synthetase
MSRRKWIPIAHPLLTGNEKKYVNECIDTTWISSVGRFIPLFEERFARFCSIEHAVACNSGTSALHLALAAFDVGPGDEVIIPSLTYVATANAVRYCGATPVFVDSEPRTMNLDPRRVEAAITSRTKGILPVHLYGHPVDMDPLVEVAKRHGLFVLEDAAEAPGASYRGKSVGSLGDAAAFSFFGNKTMTTGEGGMVTTSNAGLAERIRRLRGQGVDPERRYWFPTVGYNYRMTNIQAALGVAQLEQIEVHLKARRRVAGWYRTHLAALEPFLSLPISEPWVEHGWWMYTILLNDSFPLGRDEFIAQMERENIETRPVFYPVNIQPPYRGLPAYCPVAADLSRRGVSLPTHALLTEDDIRYIADRIDCLCASEVRGSCRAV